MKTKAVKPVSQIQIVFTPTSTATPTKIQTITRTWTRSVCPNCSYTKADVDPDGVTWCPACGYSQKGCYT